jgi:hypothetical protein
MLRNLVWASLGASRFALGFGAEHPDDSAASATSMKNGVCIIRA